MIRNRLLVGLAAVVVLCAAAAVRLASRRKGLSGAPRGAVVAENVRLRETAGVEERRVIRAVVSAAASAAIAAEVTIDGPQNESVFPPDMVAPRFLWHDAGRADRWVIDIALEGRTAHIYVLSDGPPPSPGPIDERCVASTNEGYQLTPYQASARTWTPTDNVWEAIKARSIGQPVVATWYGWGAGAPSRVLSKGQVTLKVSADPVGAPIFYRDVPLMPSPTEEGKIKPLASHALPLIAWRLRDVSRPDSRVVLSDMPTCGNCHSFSLDGKTLGMDIDGPTGDKGAYAVAPVSQHMVIEAKDIITWNSFPDKPADHKTIGFLSRVAPDGRHVVTTVNESLYVVNFMDHRFLQVFYPTRGILAYYSRETGQMRALPGADDPAFVQCDPAWSPDGEWVVFARAPARDSFEEGRPCPLQANDPTELPMQYDLYRVPFNSGKGGPPEPIEGASHNGVSNTFPKVSPDGKWIVFVKCRNGQLMRPDSELWIVPFEGGRVRRMRCNLSLMNSWHSFSPNGRWMVFSSKANTPYTQMFLTHIDEDGNDSPAILVPDSTKANRAVNIPEFVNIGYDDLVSIKTPAVEYYRHFERGNARMIEGKLEEAIAEFRKALATEPTAVRINCNVAECLMHLGRYDEALAHVRRALVTDPRNSWAYNNLGAILVRAGKAEQAIEPLRKAIQIEPDYATAHYNLGRILAGKGKMMAAAHHLRRAVEAGRQPADGFLDLGRVLAHLGRADEAAEAFRRAIDIDPSLADAHDSLGLVLLKAGDFAGAVKQFRRAVDIDPQHRSAQTNLLWAKRQLRRQASADAPR